MAANKSVLGANLMRLREERGLSGRALATLAGVHSSAIGPIESGKNTNPEAKTLLALAKALGVSPSDLDPQFGKAPSPAALAPHLRAELAFVLLADDPAAAKTWLEKRAGRASRAFEAPSAELAMQKMRTAYADFLAGTAVVTEIEEGEDPPIQKAKKGKPK